MGGITVQPNEITEVLNRPISQELLARDLTRLAYVAKDGTPRNVPIAFTWNGSEIVMCTTKNAPKLPALRNNPTVALTIDTEVHPPKILLIRGRAELDFVDGIPDEYLQANSTYEMTPEQRVEWEAEVRSLYHDGMVRIVVTPTWAKLIDFETTLPSAVEELVRQREERQRALSPRRPPECPGGMSRTRSRLRPRSEHGHNGPYTKENMMAKYLLLKHYRGGPAPAVDFAPMDQWTPDEVDAHVQFMRDFAARLEETGEFVDTQALAPDGAFVRYDGEGRPPVTDGPFAETKDLIAGWYIIDVESWDRAVQLAGELSAAPGPGGKPIYEWLEVRPFMADSPTVTE